ncbi:MAG TPA: hypothetical protein VK586_18830, partial [Streptosporangiaceae bacterium]|nr:hypothetical protein [Streptosporangiaceae bacterium]
MAEGQGASAGPAPVGGAGGIGAPVSPAPVSAPVSPAPVSAAPETHSRGAHEGPVAPGGTMA